MISRGNSFNLLYVLATLFIICGCTNSTPVYNLTTSATPSEAGSVSPASAHADEGEQLQITATANEHWVFTEWQGDLSGTSNPASILIDRDKTVTALFEKRDYPLTVTVNDEDGGHVEERLVSSKTTDYPHESVVELTAIASNGWEFTGWSGDVSGVENPEAETINVTISGPMNVTANFEQLVVVTVEGNGTVKIEFLDDASKTASASSNGERRARATATADEDWVFHKWSGDIRGSENPIEFTFTDESTIEAVFLIETETTIDIDGNVYRTVEIGSQIWLAENLRVSHYRDGSEIPGGLSNSDWELTSIGAHAIYPHDLADGINSVEEMDQIYGKLYNWHAVNDRRGLCMEGWHIPKVEDWHALKNHVGDSNTGGKLKKPGPLYWNQPQFGYTNETGFSGIGAGLRTDNGNFAGRLAHGFWWSSTEDSTDEANRVSLDYYFEGLLFGPSNKNLGFSIRCLKNK